MRYESVTLRDAERTAIHVMNTKNKNIELMFQKGYRPQQPCEWLDAYNKTAIRDGCCGTILTGINYRNMHYVLIEL